MEGFTLPDYTMDVDFDEYIAALSDGATVKGMFFGEVTEALQAVDPDGVGGIDLAKRRYLPFSDYPQTDYLRLVEQAVQVVYPRFPTAEAVRRLGSTAVPRFSDSVIGKVVIGIFFDDIHRLIPAMVKAVKYCVSPSSVESERLDERHWLVEYREMPGSVEPLWVGATEGMLTHYGLTPNVMLKKHAPGAFDVSIQWTEP